MSHTNRPIHRLTNLRPFEFLTWLLQHRTASGKMYTVRRYQHIFHPHNNNRRFSAYARQFANATDDINIFIPRRNFDTCNASVNSCSFCILLKISFSRTAGSSSLCLSRIVRAMVTASVNTGAKATKSPYVYTYTRQTYRITETETEYLELRTIVKVTTPWPIQFQTCQYCQSPYYYMSKALSALNWSDFF